ncbi:hypothetical protein SLEP1_g16184 [Rubroshorea leprosula]|uniref:Uncharacterized protein n=1 Tax=Rubroshorea leprosula TaxID=152421 RepID=A0AAV5J0N4_9ROSI|nr:hypothetical protein SLEP1_g16184 [Rubroshorea leprosula]
MVNAVEQEAADKIAQKELELTKLREKMPLYRVDSDENESLVSYDPKYESLWTEISSLRQELDAISKHLSNHEVGQLSPHGSLDFDEELSSSKRIDHLQRKVSGNLVSTSTSLRQGNGKHEESVITVPENVDAAQLKHLSREELVSYFKNEMAKMKRNHDYKVQEMTEDYYSLKREFLMLKEKDPSLPLRKDRDFDILRKKIPEVILKLDNILVPNEKLPAFSNNADALDCSRDRLESLLLENCRLRDLVRDAACNAPCMKCELEDLDLASIVEEQVYAIMFKEAREKLGALNMKERVLKLENEKLKLDILILEASLDGKEKLLQESACDLEKEKNRFELVTLELHKLRYQINQQQILISKCNEESNFMMGDLLEALEKIERDKVQLYELNQKFAQTMKELRESNDERGRLLAITQDQQNALSLVETRERENRKQMESVITLVHCLSKAISNIEYGIAGDLKTE